MSTCDIVINTVVEETVDAVIAASEVGSPVLPNRRIGTECHQRNLNVVSVLVATQTINKVVHNIFSVVGTTTVRTTDVGGHAL